MTPFALFTAGGPGAGKSTLLSHILPGLGLFDQDPDRMMDEMAFYPGEDRLALRDRALAVLEARQARAIAARRGLVINTTAADLPWVTGLKAMLEGEGYRSAMIYVSAPLADCLARNARRAWPVPEGEVRRKHVAAEANRPALQRLFAPHWFQVDNPGDSGFAAELAALRARILALAAPDRGA